MNNPMDENEIVTRPQEQDKKKIKPVPFIIALVAATLIVAAMAIVILFACNDGQDQYVAIENPYFVAESDLEKVVYTEAFELEGEILDIYADKSLVALKTVDIDNYNYDVETVKMVNAVTGEEYHSTSIKNLRGEKISEAIKAEFCDTCGIYVVEITYYGEKDEDTTVKRFHYTAQSSPEAVGVSEDKEHECASLGDVYAIGIDEKISFFDEEMNLLSD